MIRPIDALLDFMKAEEARGVTHVYLDEAARDGLREVFERSRKPASGPAAPEPVLSAASSGPAPAAVAVEPVGAGTKAERLKALERQAESWEPARRLGTLRETMVFATGNPDARLMFVGEAPGYQEEREREPFVGPAWQKLNDILKAMGLSREEVYISNIVKFRPATPKQTTNNRKPTPGEMEACLPFVRAEIGIVQPQCIVALGGTAAEGLLGVASPVGALRGKWHEVEGVPLRVTYHPSYLLQSGAGNQTKRAVWEDMLAAMETLGLPISDKQRAYFLPKP